MAAVLASALGCLHSFLLYPWLVAVIAWCSVAVKSALGCVLRDDFADLILLGVREFVVVHFERLETGLTGKKDQQRSHAPISIVFKPTFLVFKIQVL